jgi:predicted outer membrane lipoprotein
MAAVGSNRIFSWKLAIGLAAAFSVIFGSAHKMEDAG